jgi:hypothetical protein
MGLWQSILTQYTIIDGAPGSSGKVTNKSFARNETEVTLFFQSRLLLVEEQTGDIVGDMSHTLPVNEDPSLAKLDEEGRGDEPVVVDVVGEGDQTKVTVSPLSKVRESYGKSDSRLVGAAEYVSSGIIFAAEKAASGLDSVANSYKTKNKPTESPIVFRPATKST